MTDIYLDAMREITKLTKERDKAREMNDTQVFCSVCKKIAQERDSAMQETDQLIEELCRVRGQRDNLRELVGKLSLQLEEATNNGGGYH